MRTRFIDFFRSWQYCSLCRAAVCRKWHLLVEVQPWVLGSCGPRTWIQAVPACLWLHSTVDPLLPVVWTVAPVPHCRSACLLRGPSAGAGESLAVRLQVKAWAWHAFLCGAPPTPRLRFGCWEMLLWEPVCMQPWPLWAGAELYLPSCSLCPRALCGKCGCAASSTCWFWFRFPVIVLLSEKLNVRVGCMPAMLQDRCT